MGAYAEVQITCGTDAEADVIARVLVEGRLAACVQATPITSVYRWEGEVHRDREVLLLVKTRADRFGDIAAAVTAAHSYDLPAITMVPLGGTPETLAWIDEQVADAEG